MNTYKLDNGLTLITHYMPNQVVTVDCWIGTGSAEETPEEFGIAHFLEHMMFKGTERFGVNELDSVVTDLGGEWNAGTSMDFTHYHLTVPAMHFETATDIIADMMQNAAISPEEFLKERSVILEEIRRKQDSPSGAMFEKVYEAAFELGPYRHPVLGTMETVGAMTREMMADFYSRFYTPDNATLVIAGDVDAAEAETVARKYFGQWAGKRPSQPTYDVSFAKATEQTELLMDVTENYQALAWPAPPACEMQKMLALDVASEILAGGRSTRLVQAVKEQAGLVGSISCGAPSHKSDSIFYLYTAHEPKNAADARVMALEELHKFAQEGPTAEELARSKRKLRNDLYYTMEESEDVTSTVGYWHVLTGSTELVERYAELLDTVSADDVRTVISDLLQFEPVIVSVSSK